MKGPLKTHGGKRYLAKRIVSLMPTHTHYVEPYAGGLAVLFGKSPEGISEVVNDLDGRFTNFWRFLKTKSFSPSFGARFKQSSSTRLNGVMPKCFWTLPTASRIARKWSSVRFGFLCLSAKHVRPLQRFQSFDAKPHALRHERASGLVAECD